MSAEMATLYGAIIAGVFILAGLVVERLLRSVGRLWCETSRWEFRPGAYRKTGDWGKDLDPPVVSTWVTYNVTLDFFNQHQTVPATSQGGNGLSSD